MDAPGRRDRTLPASVRRLARAARIRSASAVRRPLRWLATGSLPRYRRSAGPYLVLAPHPDDESLGCGGTIAALRAASIKVTVVVVTDGSGSDTLGRDAKDVAEARRREALTACAELGVAEDDVHLLGLPDGQLHQLDSKLDRLLEEIYDRTAPAEILVCTALDRHPDHRALNAACLRIAPPDIRITEYLVWAWANWPRSGFRCERESAGRLAAARRTFATLRLARRHSIRAVLEAKRRAVLSHSSQIGDGGPGRGIPRTMAFDHLASSEVLITVRRGAR